MTAPSLYDDFVKAKSVYLVRVLQFLLMKVKKCA
ncbi:uncharacterized protein METZ01_LOCUS82596 [marine metagenome]|uniref:Uncharacterized protein n=1 Tax=marine metagenome TaxID=408172 RepID=A0A381UNL2_9ZZZZ